MTTKTKPPKLYINRVRVHLSGGPDKGKEFEPGQHISPLDHLDPLQIQLLLNIRAYAPHTPDSEVK